MGLPLFQKFQFSVFRVYIFPGSKHLFFSMFQCFIFPVFQFVHCFRVSILHVFIVSMFVQFVQLSSFHCFHVSICSLNKNMFHAFLHQKTGWSCKPFAGTRTDSAKYGTHTCFMHESITKSTLSRDRPEVVRSL